MWHGPDSAMGGHLRAKVYTIALYPALYHAPIPGPYTLPYTAAQSARPPYPLPMPRPPMPHALALYLYPFSSLSSRGGGEEGAGQGRGGSPLPPTRIGLGIGTGYRALVQDKVQRPSIDSPHCTRELAALHHHNIVMLDPYTLHLARRILTGCG